MKFLNVVSTLACFTLLSTYSSVGFAKSGNGDSYSGPTLSGNAIAMTSDKPIRDSQLAYAIEQCLLEGGEKSYLSTVLNPFYDNQPKYLSTDRGDWKTFHVKNKNEEVSLKVNNYFNDQTSNSSQKELTDFNPDDLTMSFSYLGNFKKYTSKRFFKKTDTYIETHLDVLANLSKDGTLKLKLSSRINYNRYLSNEYFLQEQKRIFVPERLLIIKGLPGFKAQVKNVNTYDQVTGDLIRSDKMLMGLQMIYNEQDAYSQVLNASHDYNPVPTQVMAPNAELADCISDNLGRL